jgi:hypothetical protein
MKAVLFFVLRRGEERGGDSPIYKATTSEVCCIENEGTDRV